MAPSPGRAHTLPIGYLRLVPASDYLHLEFIFNPFELSFVSEVDENKDGDLDPAELKKHGESVAKRVVAAFRITADGKALAPETSGMDPDMSGHHVRLRAHYKLERRPGTVKVVSDLNSITSASHIVQVTFTGPGQPQLAQLDSQSRTAVFTLSALPNASKPQPKPNPDSQTNQPASKTPLTQKP